MHVDKSFKKNPGRSKKKTTLAMSVFWEHLVQQPLPKLQFYSDYNVMPLLMIVKIIVSHHFKVFFYLIGWLASPILLLAAILLIGVNDDDNDDA